MGLVRLILILGTLKLALGVTAHAQVQPSWIARFPGNGSVDPGVDWGNMKVSPQGEIYVLRTLPDTNLHTAIVLLKYDRQGQLIWSTQYQDLNQADSWATILAIGSNGCLWVCGSLQATNGVRDLLLLQYSSNGQLLTTDSLRHLQRRMVRFFLLL